MRIFKIKIMVILLTTAVVVLNALEMEKGLLFWNNNTLEKTKTALEQHKNQLYESSYKKLLVSADKALNKGPFSVMQKSSIPPSGDKHDYTSMSPYWWPNPDTKDGLPYIKKDGQVNPESRKYDKLASAAMSENIRYLSLAYYFSNDENYARKAAELLKTWFIHPSTRMNPNMNFAQFVPGKSEGRSYGVIQSRVFIYTIDAVSLLKDSKYWKDEDQKAYDNWMKEFYHWLRTSKLGQSEFSNVNNHGTWCDVQLLALAIYNDDFTFAKQLINDFYERRIKKQIKLDGTQPLELERTRALFYSIFNLRATVMFLSMAERIEPGKVKQIMNQDSRMKNALIYLIPYIKGENEWPYQQINSLDKNIEELIQIGHFYDNYYDDPIIDDFLSYVSDQRPSSIYHLLYNQE